MYKVAYFPPLGGGIISSWWGRGEGEGNKKEKEKQKRKGKGKKGRVKRKREKGRGRERLETWGRKSNRKKWGLENNIKLDATICIHTPLVYTNEILFLFRFRCGATVRRGDAMRFSSLAPQGRLWAVSGLVWWSPSPHLCCASVSF